MAPAQALQMADMAAALQLAQMDSLGRTPHRLLWAAAEEMAQMLSHRTRSK